MGFSKPDDVITALFAAWNTKDPEAFGALFPTDAEWVDVLGQVMEGNEGIAVGHRPPFERILRGATLVRSTTRIRTLSDTLASIDASWRMTGHVSPQGDPLLQREGSIHLITARREGGWVPLIGHNQDYTRTYVRNEDGSSPLD